MKKFKVEQFRLKDWAALLAIFVLGGLTGVGFQHYVLTPDSRPIRLEIEQLKNEKIYWTNEADKIHLEIDSLVRHLVQLEIIEAGYPITFFGQFKLRIFNPDRSPDCRLSTQRFIFELPVSRQFFNRVPEGLIVKADAPIYYESAKYEYWEIELINKFQVTSKIIPNVN